MWFLDRLPLCAIEVASSNQIEKQPKFEIMGKKKKDLTWSELLFQAKYWIAVLLLISPIIIILYFKLFETEKEDYLYVTIGLISIQVGLALNLIYDVIKDDKKRDSSEITDITSQSDFWKKDAKYEEFIIFSINGRRFIDALVKNNIKVNKVKLIFPNEESIKIFYSNYSNITQKEKAVDKVQEAIEETKISLETAKGEKIIKNFEIKFSGTFPSSFLAIFDGSNCMHGKYIPDKYRTASIGLKSACWLVRDTRKIFYLQQYFYSLWEVL